MALGVSQALQGLGDKLTPSVTQTPDDPNSRSGGGIDIHTPVGGASIKDVSANRTNYDVHAGVPSAHAGVQFGENTKTKAIESGHASLGFGSKGKGITVDGGFDGCTASIGVQASIPAAQITIPGGKTIGVGVPTPHVGISFPIPGCNPHPPPPFNPAGKPRSLKKLKDYAGLDCAFYLVAVWSSVSFGVTGSNSATYNLSSDYDVFNEGITQRNQARNASQKLLTDENFVPNSPPGSANYLHGITVVDSLPINTFPLLGVDQDGISYFYELSSISIWVLANADIDSAITENPSLEDYGILKAYHWDNGPCILPDPIDRNTPPPPNPPPKNPMSDCCQAISRQNDDIKKQQDQQNEDLALLKKQVQAIYNVLNPQEFESGGTSVPKRLLYPGGSGQEEIKDYPHLFAAIIRQIDTANGYFPMEITIADANPTKGVNQAMKLKVNSLADGVKLLIQHLIETEGDTDATLNFDVRTAYTLVAMQQEVAKIGQTTTNIEDYLGYKVKHSKVKVPCVFNPFVDLHKGKNFLPWSQADIDNLSKKSLEEVIPQLLKERDIDVKITELDEKKLLNESLLELLRGVQACRGALTHEYKGESPLKDFLDMAVSTRQLGGFFHREDIRQVLEVGDMNNFQHDVEEGYSGTVQNADINVDKRPYNKSPASKPRIKKVSKRRRKGRG